MREYDSDKYDMRVTGGTNIIRHDGEGIMSFEPVLPKEGGSWTLAHIWGESVRNVVCLWVRLKKEPISSQDPLCGFCGAPMITGEVTHNPDVYLCSNCGKEPK